MPSSYPGSLDSFSTKVDNVTDVLAAHMNDVQNAIVATQTELGTDPAGAFATVKLRLANHPLNKLDATAAPTTGDDTNDGYGVGSMWLDVTNDRWYMCLDASAGSAIWYEVTNKWITWTPTITQSGSVVVTVNAAKYAVCGKVCKIFADMTVTGSGTAGNTITLSGIPAAVQTTTTGATRVVGNGVIQDAGTANYYAIVTANAADGLVFNDTNTRGVIGVNPNFGLAANDVIDFTAVWDIA